MASYEFDWVDAFTTVPMGGNPCVVVHGAADLPAADRIRLVRETRLSECAYLVPSETADFGARYYLATEEIPMAGHPTVATVASLLDRGLVTLSGGEAEFTLEVGAGILPIRVTQSGDAPPVITMKQFQPTFGAVHDRAEVADIFGLGARHLLDDPQTVSTGSAFCVMALRDHSVLRRARLDSTALAQWLERPSTDCRMIFLTVPQGVTEAGQTFSRLLIAPPGPAEDPFTGSATGCMAAYFWNRGHLEQPRFVAEQGYWMDRPGQALVEVLGPRKAPTGVLVGGSGCVLMRGQLTL
ncbi:PhzF family phenazine biosynthesis isomerase [Pseudooceanicola sp. 216_PA32_1]|uniref:PhzF family phenazine biosynthesis isomerase n=1 Tax=Pseudooceanicola pacificus TaxID=2676438 RepID=A0A844WDM2_9RHOB|nr:PhzF family phenazine biosynthesis protein [Pseudooceanicola pacificus]MWB77820.1 PhzF family phenazine biosynthesis isomerase [Pseudooceanicola pacificus]